MDGHVGVAGAGTMGAGIAQVALEAGHEVRLFDLDRTAVERARARIRSGLTRRLTRTATDPLAIRELVELRLDRLAVVGSLAELAEDAGLVIEAAVEDLAVKRRLFAVLDAAAPADALLASNTSALSIGEIATAVRRPARVIGLHFFNPAPVMALVEVIAGPRTDPATADTAITLMTAWGKTPITSADLPGFIVNRVNRPFTLEALRALERGAASTEEIDAALRTEGFPMGPFELMDLTGIDVTTAVSRAIADGFAARGDPDFRRFEPSQIQVRMIAEGRLGRKTGLGFYEYDAEGRRSGQTADAAPTPASLRIAEGIRRAILAEAHRAVGDGVALPADVDLALRLGAGHPQGPFEWERASG